MFPANVLAEISRIPADLMHADSMRFLDKALEGHRVELFSDTRNILTQAIISKFGSFRAFHACKPTCLDSYFSNGILPLSKAWLIQNIVDLYDGDVSSQEVEASLDLSHLGGRLGQVCFVTDPLDLIEHAGHYLLRGAESMCCVGNGNAGRFLLIRNRQLAHGIPTVFECAVPMGSIDDSWRDVISSHIVTRYFQELSDIAPTYRHSRDFAVVIRKALPPENIVGHFHPAVIPDPDRLSAPYVNKSTTCPHCGWVAKPTRMHLPSQK
jgi:hypothetical protein